MAALVSVLTQKDTARAGPWQYAMRQSGGRSPVARRRDASPETSTVHILRSGVGSSPVLLSAHRACSKSPPHELVVDLALGYAMGARRRAPLRDRSHAAEVDGTAPRADPP